MALPAAVIDRAASAVKVRHYYQTGSNGRHKLFHDTGATVSDDLHSPCPVLDTLLEVDRRQARNDRRRLAALKAQLIREDVEVTLSSVQGPLVDRTCNACRANIQLRLEEELRKLDGLRSGWHVDLGAKAWQCDVHGRPHSCRECGIGWD